MQGSSSSERTQVKRGAKRAIYEAGTINEILDNSFLCHVGYTVDGECRVIPTAYVRLGNALYLHGHLRNQMLQALLEGQTACVTVTELNGLVLARSGFHHSVNYRSVVLFGKATVVAEADKIPVLDALIDHLVPKRAAQIRPHTKQELDATLVLALSIDDAAAKVRQGPPVDAEQDYELDIWAGVVPLKTVVGDVEPCPRLPSTVATPDHVVEYLALTKGD